jgi:hypothetical protein
LTEVSISIPPVVVGHDGIIRNKMDVYDADVVDACLKLFQEKSYTLVLKKYLIGWEADNGYKLDADYRSACRGKSVLY